MFDISKEELKKLIRQDREFVEECLKEDDKMQETKKEIEKDEELKEKIFYYLNKVEEEDERELIESIEKIINAFYSDYLEERADNWL